MPDIYENKLKRIKSKIMQIIRNLYYSDHEKNFMRMMFFLKKNGTKGDYAEFGVGNGEKLIMAFKFARKQKHTNTKFYGFDSFEGFPEPEDAERNKMSWTKGEYCYSLEQVKQKLESSGYDFSWQEIHLIKGFYKESFKKDYGIKKLAGVHIDCNFYNSAKESFNYIKPLIQDGTVILINSWFMFNANSNYGEQRAFLEFAEENLQFNFIEIPCHTLSKMFVVNVKQNEENNEPH